MMNTRIAILALAVAALAGCSQAPVATATVQQLDTAAVWSTGSYR